jgi:hypothetical protein
LDYLSPPTLESSTQHNPRLATSTINFNQALNLQQTQAPSSKHLRTPHPDMEALSNELPLNVACDLLQKDLCVLALVSKQMFTIVQDQLLPISLDLHFASHGSARTSLPRRPSGQPHLLSPAYPDGKAHTTQIGAPTRTPSSRLHFTLRLLHPPEPVGGVSEDAISCSTPGFSVRAQRHDTRPH